VLLPLVALGIILIAFGAFVLLRHSDRPGGTIKWLGAEVTSTGAGLPLIALGVVFIGFAVVRFPLGGSPSEPSGVAAVTDRTQPQRGDDACMTALLADVSKDRIRPIEVGMREVEVIRSDQQLNLPFVLLLTENGKRIGAIRMRRYPGTDYSSDLYKVEDAVDARCAKVDELENPGRGGNPRELQNFDALRITLAGQQYDLRIGGEGSIGIGYFRRVQA
jgi:hypothetical protein